MSTILSSNVDGFDATPAALAKKKIGRWGWFGGLLAVVGNLVFFAGLVWAGWDALTLPFSPVLCSSGVSTGGVTCQSLLQVWTPVVFWLLFVFVWLPLLPIVTGLLSLPTSLLGMFCCWLGGRRVWGTDR
jgi:hypothetical protein